MSQVEQQPSLLAQLREALRALTALREQLAQERARAREREHELTEQITVLRAAL